MKIFISHSVGCASWDMEGIYKDTSFQVACRTSRFKEEDIGKVKMLDWDYLEWLKDPKKIEEKHLQLVKENRFDVVMSMDYWDYNRLEALTYADKLQKYADRVLIPVHYFDPEVLDYELAYPNANWFSKNTFPPYEYRCNIIHILGGSPQSQLKLVRGGQMDLFGREICFPAIESIDGNQIFNVSIRVGKEWFPNKPYWRKPKIEISNEQIFKNSVQRMNSVFSKF